MKKGVTMELVRLTHLLLELNSMLDSRNYDDLGLAEVKQRIDDGTILRFLRDRGGNDIDLSLHVSDASDGFEQWYVAYLQSIYDAYRGDERRKWGVSNRGLCLLIAWTNEMIQQGSGWRANDNFARR
jgi:hypothetical protein